MMQHSAPSPNYPPAYFTSMRENDRLEGPSSNSSFLTSSSASSSAKPSSGWCKSPRRGSRKGGQTVRSRCSIIRRCSSPPPRQSRGSAAGIINATKSSFAAVAERLEDRSSACTAPAGLAVPLRPILKKKTKNDDSTVRSSCSSSNSCSSIRSSTSSLFAQQRTRRVSFALHEDLDPMMIYQDQYSIVTAAIAATKPQISSEEDEDGEHNDEVGDGYNNSQLWWFDDPYPLSDIDEEEQKQATTTNNTNNDRNINNTRWNLDTNPHKDIMMTMPHRVVG